MIHVLQLINTETSESITISKNGDSVFVLNSVNWNEPEVQYSSYRLAGQIGFNVNGIVVRDRQVEIIGYIIANEDVITADTWDAYYEEQRKQIVETKKILNKFISPFQQIIIKADEKYLIGFPQPVRYSINEPENSEVVCKFVITVLCSNPLFSGETKTIALSTVTPKFHFPIDNNETFVMGEVIKRQTMEIENNGDVDAGLIITMKAVGGSVVNPYFYNVQKGTSIRLENFTLLDGQTLIINTNDGEESAIVHSKDGSEKSLVGNIKKGSEYIKASIGSSYFSYYASSGHEFADVVIQYMERYFNIDEM